MLFYIFVVLKCFKTLKIKHLKVGLQSLICLCIINAAGLFFNTVNFYFCKWLGPTTLNPNVVSSLWHFLILSCSLDNSFSLSPFFSVN